MYLIGPEEIVDLLVNGAMLALGCMIAYLLWELRSASAKRRQASRDREIARWLNE